MSYAYAPNHHRLLDGRTRAPCAAVMGQGAPGSAGADHAFTAGATSEPSNSIERCIASVSSIAELIWNVMRDTPPRAVFASRILSRTVFGLPIRNVLLELHMASNWGRVAVDQPRSRPISVNIYAQPGKKASFAASSVSPTKPNAWTPTVSTSGA